MRERRRAWLAVGAVVAVVGIVPFALDRDSFPLSTFPMFSADIDATQSIDTAVGVGGDGTTLRLEPELIGGTTVVNQAVAVVQAAVAAGTSAAVLGLTIAAGIAAIVGWRWWLVAPAFAVLYLLIGTYRVSWGHVSHGDHLPAVHLLLLALMPAADAWSLDRRRRPTGEAGPASRYGWPVRVLAVATVVTYVLAGLAKLRYGGFGWIDGSVLRNQIATDTLQKILLGATHSPVGGWLAAHPWTLPAAAAGALVVELGAPVALLGGWWRNVWVAAAWLFHVSIAVVMAIGFPYPLYGVAFAPFFAVEDGVGAIRRWFERRRPRRSAA